MNDLEIMEKLKSDFELWFKTTPYYSGENCSPKYETYRMMWKAYFKGLEHMVELYLDDSWSDDFGNSSISDNCLASDIIFSDNLFK